MVPDMDRAQLEENPTSNRNVEKKYVGIKVDLINHLFKLEFVNSGLYFVQDENNFIIRCNM